MKKKYFVIAIIVILILSVPKIKERTEPIENKIILADISSDENKELKTKTLAHFRIIQENLQKEYQLLLYKSHKNLQLYRIDKYNGGHPSHRYYVFDSDKNTVFDFSNVNLIVDSVRNGFLSNDEAILALKYHEVNLNYFNKIFSDISQADKMSEYAKLFALNQDSINFRILKRKEDILNILASAPRSEHQILQLVMGDSTDIINDYSFIDSIGKNELLIWDLNSGIKKYSFKFKGSDIQTVEPKSLGLIGNERTIQL